MEAREGQDAAIRRSASFTTAGAQPLRRPVAALFILKIVHARWLLVFEVLLLS